MKISPLDNNEATLLEEIYLNVKLLNLHMSQTQGVVLHNPVNSTLDTWSVLSSIQQYPLYTNMRTGQGPGPGSCDYTSKHVH